MPVYDRVDRDLLQHARRELAHRERLWWVLGGAGTGKSTVSRELARRHGLALLDMDERIYGLYHGRFDPDRHPANTAWSRAENGLTWLLSLSWPAFDAFNHSAAAEYLDLLASELHATPDAPTIVDGGLACASVLAEVVQPQRVVCLAHGPTCGAGVWEDEGRVAMRDAVLSLPRGEALWQTFLRFDRAISETLVRESLASGIRVLPRDPAIGVEGMVARVARHFGL